MRPGFDNPSMGYQPGPAGPAGPPYSQYGTLHAYNGQQDPQYLAFSPEKFQTSRPPRHTSPVEVIVGIFLPWGIFASLFAMVSLPVHYSNPSLVWVLDTLLGLFVMGLGAVALMNIRNNGFVEAKWYAFYFVTSLVAWILATTLGEMNYTSNIAPFLDIINLNYYPSVDPNTTSGQLLMDAGRIGFVEGSHLDLSKSIAFRNIDFYCVAPVIRSPQFVPVEGGGSAIHNYDFWAVGVNCCTGRGDFHCGDFQNAKTQQGLRLMREDQREYFRLAVETAQAHWNIRAEHPIFIHWIADASTEIEAYHTAGYLYLIYGFVFMFLGQVFLVTVNGMVLRPKE
jgi:hypothetical protein